MAALLEVFRPEYWPLLVAMGVLVVAAVLFVLLGRVPNAFTFSAIAAGWIAPLAVPQFGGPVLEGSVLGSLACTAVGLLMLAKLYKMGLGAGCLKAQMAFGAWVGCALELKTAVIATCATTLWACACAIVASIIWARLCGRPTEKFSFADPQPGLPDDAGQPRPLLIPAQAMLSAGTIAGLLFLFWLDAQGAKPYLPHNQERLAAQVNNVAGQ
jgi:hypothetical protein